MGTRIISRHKYPPSLGVYRMKKKGKTVSWRDSLISPRMGFFTPIRPICDPAILVKIISWVGRHIARNDRHHRKPRTSSQFCVSLTDRNWKNCGRAPTVCEPRFRKLTPQETFHLVERKASFSLRLGCGLGTGCGELGRLFFGMVALMSAFIDNAIRLDFASALSTFTLTICPALTASEGSLMNRFESSLMCTRPS